MQFKSTNILEFFDSSQKHFVIPVYQRAYSWTNHEWEVFLNDIREQINSGNNYFYGNVLLETIKKGVKYEVIDGQQRLTTLTIFVRAIIDVLEKKDGNEIDLKSKEKIYLKNNGNVKIRTVEYDRAFFEAVIVEGKKEFPISSVSQNNIIKARDYFSKELSKETTPDLQRILEKVEETELTCIELNGKKDSALMFELQNNRGKDLTNMEKIKSFFMYQAYVYSSGEEVDSNIEYISNVFKGIYLLVNNLTILNEDSVLLYHCNAYIKGYNYRGLDDIKSLINKSDDKIQTIKAFVNELNTTFFNLSKLKNMDLLNLTYLFKLSIPAFIYPFIIKGLKFLNGDIKKLNSLFHILEIVLFRYKLINSRADITSRLNSLLISFSGDISLFKKEIYLVLKDSWYWSDEHLENHLSYEKMYKNPVLPYLLGRYENSLQTKGYSINIESLQIEHIFPQTQPEGEALESGYEFILIENEKVDIINDYVNSLGNLVLISGSHNASIGNKAFIKKLKSYNENPSLKQQTEIESFSVNGMWTRDSIGNRHFKIVDFAIKEWSFDSVITD